MPRLVISLLLIVLGLSACQTGMLKPSQLFHVLAGGEFILHQDVTIPPGRVRVAFQDGALVHGVNEFYPRCELEVMKFSEAPQTVPAGTYRIGKVVGMTNQVKQADGNIMLASSISTGLDMGSAQWIMEAYRMTLHSDQQEDVLILSCGGAYNYPFRARYPSLQEIQTALGAIATIKLR
ncbi:MAG: hypothetical protein WBO57_05280 [Gammaproteobacteria bacterium]